MERGGEGMGEEDVDGPRVSSLVVEFSKKKKVINL